MTTDASLNARRLGAIDRPLASPYSTNEIPVSLRHYDHLSSAP